MCHGRPEKQTSGAASSDKWRLEFKTDTSTSQRKDWVVSYCSHTVVLEVRSLRPSSSVTQIYRPKLNIFYVYGTRLHNLSVAEYFLATSKPRDNKPSLY